MKISSIGYYLDQSQAAILVLLAEHIMRRAEQTIQDPSTEEKKTIAYEAQEAAYVLRSVGEQSIVDNDGMLFTHLEAIRANPVLVDYLNLDGWWEKAVAHISDTEKNVSDAEGDACAAAITASQTRLGR